MASRLIKVLCKEKAIGNGVSAEEDTGFQPLPEYRKQRTLE